jgi:hypothetical protein
VTLKLCVLVMKAGSEISKTRECYIQFLVTYSGLGFLLDFHKMSYFSQIFYKRMKPLNSVKSPSVSSPQCWDCVLCRTCDFLSAQETVKLTMLQFHSVLQRVLTGLPRGLGGVGCIGETKFYVQ